MTTSAYPITSTIWNATARVRQPLQLASAHASLRCSTLLPSVTQTRASTTSDVVEPSVVLTDTTWLSPARGSRGGAHGNGHVGVLVDSPCDAGAAATGSAGGAGAGSGGGAGGSGSGASGGGAGTGSSGASGSGGGKGAIR